MKLDQLKKIIALSVKEAMKDQMNELKVIIYEAMLAQQKVAPTYNTVPVPTPKSTSTNLREQYQKLMQEIQGNANSLASAEVIDEPDIPFRPITGDIMKGNLGDGDVSLDQIDAILNGSV